MNAKAKSQAIFGQKAVEFGPDRRYNVLRLIIIPMRHNIGPAPKDMHPYRTQSPCIALEERGPLLHGAC